MLKTEEDPFSETLWILKFYIFVFYILFTLKDDGQSPKNKWFRKLWGLLQVRVNTQLHQWSPALWNNISMFTYTRQWHAWNWTRECLATWEHRRNVQLILTWIECSAQGLPATTLAALPFCTWFIYGTNKLQSFLRS
jgi:hypothetical protein